MLDVIEDSRNEFKIKIPDDFEESINGIITYRR